MNKKVFLAESNPGVENGLSQRIRALGFELFTTQVPDHVTQLLAGKVCPDIFVFNDCPFREFSDTLCLIRSNPHIAHIPVLAVVSDEAGAGQRLAAGAQGFVKLPFDQDVLRDEISTGFSKVQTILQPPTEVLNAPDRLADLDETELLDSLPSAALDRLTRLASKLIGAPVSLVSLVDRDRQFFKSQTGLGEPLCSERQTKLSHSFCQWVVSGGTPLIIDDAHEHPVLRNNPAVQELSVVAYAGVPLLGRRRKPIGSFCVVDTAPRKWEDHNVELLKDLGAAIEAIAISNVAAARQMAATEDWPPLWVRLIGEGTLGAVRVLRSYGERLQAQERRDLMDVIEHQASLLLKGTA